MINLEQKKLHFLLVVSFKRGRVERLESTFIIYNYIFHAPQCEKHLNLYSYLLKEIMFPYGIGLEKIFQKRESKYLNSL
jgi:hypothetical protein